MQSPLDAYYYGLGIHSILYTGKTITTKEKLMFQQLKANSKMRKYATINNIVKIYNKKW